MATVLITGANRGIGLEFVKQYLARGENVIGTCRDIEAAEALAQLSANNENLQLLKLDVANDESLMAFPAQLVNSPIDIFTKNA